MQVKCLDQSLSPDTTKNGHIFPYHTMSVKLSEHRGAPNTPLTMVEDEPDRFANAHGDPSALALAYTRLSGSRRSTGPGSVSSV
jgi:hypothetical protein